MSDRQDEFLEEPEIIEEKQSSRPRNKKRSGGLLNLLSGIFVAGTIGVGLLFTIIFIDPQSSLNPLHPTTIPAPILTSPPSSTPKPILPPTWTPTILPSDTPTLTPIPTDTPLPTVGNSPTSEADAVNTDVGCDLLGIGGQSFDMDYLLANTQFLQFISETQVASTLTAPIPTEEILTKTLSPDHGISDLFTPEIQYWEDDILAWGKEYGLDPNLIATVMTLESCGYTKAKSAAGAMGLFQVMPQYFKGKENPYDPDTNAYKGLSWLQITLKSGGSIRMALAGYNAGLARARNPYLEWPHETQRYVNWGLYIYHDATCGFDSSSALEHWLSKGGSSLCYLAAREQQGK